MSIFCPQCAVEIPENSAVCPNCGHATSAAVRARGTVGVFPENIAGALAYITVVPAIVFLLIDPYRRNRFVRFHSLQCLFLWLALFLIAAVMRVLEPVIFLIPSFGYLLFLLIAMVVTLGAFVIWLVLVIKALQGEAFKLPVVGELAQRQAAVTHA
jgi:uncharacterized membrane protein